ncbi:MAG TPA: c-type cytochrome [Xanthomonadaceae bacterium]|nr:c-type cytochrome [Xanthomonadaceae bacterium]
MRHARAIGIAALAALAVGAAAFAQTVTPLPEAEPVQATPIGASAVADLAKAHWGDAKAGATKAGACAACHGVDGNPSDPQYPRLAGMPERYIATQLALYKSGERNTGMAAIMQPMAAPLSAQDMRDVGAYFAQQKAGAGIADDTAIADGPYQGMKFYEVGQKLFLGGDPQRGIPACMACHGPTGAGNPGPAYPHVAGQQSAYVARRLEEYRAGQTSLSDRHNWDIMASVARQLSDQEIQSLASYLQGLHARSEEAAADDVARAAAQPAPAPAEPQG